MALCDKSICITLRKVEVAEGIGDLGAGIGEPFEYLEKEDMSDMFRRAMLEKMQFVGRLSVHINNGILKRKSSANYLLKYWAERHLIFARNQSLCSGIKNLYGCFVHCECSWSIITLLFLFKIPPRTAKGIVFTSLSQIFRLRRRRFLLSLIQIYVIN
jgi:hypothetical protein